MADGVVYDSAGIYVASRTTNLQKIAAIDAIISKLEEMALISAGTINIDDYSLDDGQTKIKTKYRSGADITTAIMDFMKIREIYINRVNGRQIRLVDSRNFTGRE